jgi:hypothetical protein
LIESRREEGRRPHKIVKTTEGSVVDQTGLIRKGRAQRIRLVGNGSDGGAEKERQKAEERRGEPDRSRPSEAGRVEASRDERVTERPTEAGEIAERMTDKKLGETEKERNPDRVRQSASKTGGNREAEVEGESELDESDLLDIGTDPLGQSEQGPDAA